jgi:pyruvate,water dikinase
MFEFEPDSLILPLDSPAATLERTGGKGASLARLATAGLPVPPGFHVTTDAYRQFVRESHLSDVIQAAASRADPKKPVSLDRAAARIQALMAQGSIPEAVASAIRRAYVELGADDPAVAVRSSATAEDLPGMSFAGQQDTYLNVRGAEAVLAAVQRCWASLWTARAIGYRARQGIAPGSVSLAVVVQQLVPADAAGILFTANPLTGSRDELMINAAWGLGEAVVGGLVTPDSFVVDKTTGAITVEEIADKQVMTVRLADGTQEQPVPAERRRESALTRPQVNELAELGTRIEELYDQPMDIEWAFAEGRPFILQARPVTALPELRLTLDWTTPRAGGRYARSSVIELLPEPVSPLFATLGLPAWNEAMWRFISLAWDSPDSLQYLRLLTINDYAYYDFGLTNADAVRMMGSFVAHGRHLARHIGSAHSRWAEEARPRYAGVAGEWAGRDLGPLPALLLLDGVQAIVDAAADHYLSIQSGILPVAYMSEAAFTSTYDRLAKRAEDPPALTYMLGYDSSPIRAEKSLYDLAQWAREQPALADYLAGSPSADIAAALQPGTAPVADADAWSEFRMLLDEHLAQFGHTVYDLDFAKHLPLDDPTPLLETLKYFLTDEARNPYERQAAAASAREAATTALLGRLGGPRRKLFTRLLDTAQKYVSLREDALADVGLGWPQLRRLLREVGRRLATAESIAAADDVFWLTWDELRSAATALDSGETPVDHRDAVAERQATHERERQVTPPVTLPPKGGAVFLGMDFARFMPAPAEPAAGATLKGVAASPGRVTAVARVLHGPGDFGQMHNGDILVAKITTPAWTPLFALAAGVVTDVGGPLSHGSIVAREYGIPAVLGTGVATERIASGNVVTVDGDTGEVTIGG